MHQLSHRQVIVGGCALAFAASFLNTGFLIYNGTSVSHLTGDISRIASGIFILQQDTMNDLWMVLIATLGFILGAMSSGYLIHHPTLEIHMPYGRILTSLGVLLFVAHILYAKHAIVAIALGSFACGTQNALASRYRGVVLRTTHLTGLFTDLGIHLGMKLRGHDIENWKIAIPLVLSISFFLGATTSSALIVYTQADWILYAAVGYFVGGLGWSIYKRYSRSLNDISQDS
ncbi:YoaK family protein [Cerasicoccus fimbriatus]|uniref:YoaK family protein n=1 Tax=Cerasicoccus fimbriatus TaxID=3014554 RepID=UPI0022B457D2|nr:YoaK family protein [Cerasicoccus sp. TK19100]